MKYPWVSKPEPNKDGLPTVFYLETAMACNMFCPECAIGSGMTKRIKKILKLDDFYKISEKIRPYAKMVMLHKWGEPLLNKDLSKMIKNVSEYAHVHIMTNGELFTDEKIEEILTSGIGTLFFSIDGVTQDVYEIYRVGGKLETVINNLKKVKNFIDKNNIEVDLIAQFIAFQHNEHQIDDFKKFCESINVRFHIRSAYVRFGKIKMTTKKEYQRFAYENLEDQLQAISKCSFLDGLMTITVSGEILLCSQDYDASFSLPNILDPNQTVETIWNNIKFLELRNKIKNKNPPKLCKTGCTLFPQKDHREKLLRS